MVLWYLLGLCKLVMFVQFSRITLDGLGDYELGKKLVLPEMVIYLDLLSFMWERIIRT